PFAPSVMDKVDAESTRLMVSLSVTCTATLCEGSDGELTVTVADPLAASGSSCAAKVTVLGVFQSLALNESIAPPERMTLGSPETLELTLTAAPAAGCCASFTLNVELPPSTRGTFVGDTMSPCAPAKLTR